MNEVKRSNLQRYTREAAIALLDDLEYMDEITKEPFPKKGDIRRLSAIIRRILIENDLQTVANPRIGSLRILYDCCGLSKLSQLKEATYIAGGLPPIYGNPFGLCMVFEQPNDVAYQNEEVFGSVDKFLAEVVFFVDGIAVNRGDLIKYVCYKEFGVHGNGKNSYEFSAIEKVKNCLLAYRDQNGEIKMQMSANPSETNSLKKELLKSNNIFTLPYVQIIGTIRYVLLSPDVINLMTFIRRELEFE